MGSNLNGVLGLNQSEEALRHVGAPQLITSLSSISQIATGRSHSVAIDVGKKVYGWGNSFEGAIGLRDAKTSCLPKEINVDDNRVI